MKVNNELLEEIKNEVNILENLVKKINTHGQPIETYVNELKSMNGIKYFNEVDRYERPQEYYHFQNGIHTAEVRKGRKDYYVICTGFRPRIEKLEVDTTEIIKKWGNNTKYIYKNEYEETIHNFLAIILEYIKDKIRIRDNLLVW